MDFVQVVTEAAKALEMLDEDGALIQLDSVSVMELIAELEHTTKVSIPASEMRAESFQSIEAIALMLQRVSKK